MLKSVPVIQGVIHDLLLSWNCLIWIILLLSLPPPLCLPKSLSCTTHSLTQQLFRDLWRFTEFDFWISSFITNKDPFSYWFCPSFLEAIKDSWLCYVNLRGMSFFSLWNFLKQISIILSTYSISRKLPF
jgi:hypothetical protein